MLSHMVFRFGRAVAPLNMLFIVLMLVFGRVRGGDEIAFVSERDGDADIYTMDVDTGIIHNVTRNTTWERDLIWSPDGSRMAFYSNLGGDWDVYTMRADGRDLRQVTDDRLFEMSLVWFRGTQQLAFVVPTGGQNRLVTLDTEGGTMYEQTYNDVINPVWSPDGQQIAFFSFARRKFGLYLMDADGRNRHLIADDFRTQTRDIAWTNDQARVALIAHGRLYVTELADGKTHLVTEVVGWLPAWSSDGTRLAFMSYRDGNAELYMTDDAGTFLRRLTFHPTNDTTPVWRP